MSRKCIKVGLVRAGEAFLPEVEAYKTYLREDPLIEVNVYDKLRDAEDGCDVVILFLGFLPFWRRPRAKVVAEYASASLGPFPRLKNLLKRLFNVRGDVYVFLNENVRKELYVGSTRPYVTRGMGFHPKLLERYSCSAKVYDFVYCGTFERRPGLVEAIEKIAGLGFSVALIGTEPSGPIFERLRSPSIRFLGRVGLESAYRFMSQAKYGLNYTPPIYPYFFQDSTKVIEYCAMGLGVVTNRYRWVDDFESEVGGRFLSLEEIEFREDVEEFQFCAGDVSAYSWENIIKKSGLAKAISNII